MQFNTNGVILQPVLLGKIDRPAHLGSPITVLCFPEDSCQCLSGILFETMYNIFYLHSFRGKCTSFFIAK